MAMIIGDAGVSEIFVGCNACGTKGHATQESGDVMKRVSDFAAQHLDPIVIAAQMTCCGLNLG